MIVVIKKKLKGHKNNLLTFGYIEPGVNYNDPRMKKAEANVSVFLQQQPTIVICILSVQKLK